MVQLGTMSIAFDLRTPGTFSNDERGIEIRVIRVCTARAFFDAHYRGFVVWDMSNSDATHKRRGHHN